jgi:hypothetical protein
MYETYLDNINGCTSGTVYFLIVPFLWDTQDLWGIQGKEPSARQKQRIALTESYRWSEQKWYFGVPSVINFFASACALYILIQAWLFSTANAAASSEAGLTVTAIVAASVSIAAHFFSMSAHLFVAETRCRVFSVLTLLLGIGDFVGMFVTILNISDLLSAYSSSSTSRALVIICSAAAAFRGLAALIFCMFRGINCDDNEEYKIDMVNASIGNFMWPVVCQLFPLHLSNYADRINRIGHSLWPAIIRSASFIRMSLLIYLNVESLYIQGGPQFERLTVISIIFTCFDFASASYMWMFCGLWERIQSLSREPDGYLIFLKNWSSFYIMSVVDLATLIVSVVNIIDLLSLFENQAAKGGMIFLLCLFLIRSVGQLLLGLQSIYRILIVLRKTVTTCELWENFNPPVPRLPVSDSITDHLAPLLPPSHVASTVDISNDDDTVKREVLLREYMFLSDCSFNSFVGIFTIIFCPSVFVRFFMQGFESISKSKPKFVVIGALNLITVIKSIANLAVCILSFVHLKLPPIQIAVLCAALILSLWRGVLSFFGFSLHDAIRQQISLKVASLLWAAAFFIICSVLAWIVSNPCSVAPLFCENDSSQCLDKNCPPASICTTNENNDYECTCPPWLSIPADGTRGGHYCVCASDFFSFPNFDRKSCVNQHTYMSLSDTVSVSTFVVGSVAAGLIWLFEWRHLQQNIKSVSFAVGVCLIFVLPTLLLPTALSVFANHPPSHLQAHRGNCSVAPLCSVTSSCSQLDTDRYVCKCPGWLGNDDRSNCTCKSSIYKIPNFERGTCVNDAYMSIGDVAGVSIGSIVTFGLVAVLLFLRNLGSEFRAGTCQNKLLFCMFIVGVLSCATIVVIASESRTLFPTPKQACGSSSADYVLCDLNAKCFEKKCICSDGYSGDGLVCNAVQPTPSPTPSPPPPTPAPDPGGFIGECDAAPVCSPTASCNQISIQPPRYTCSCPWWLDGTGVGPCTCKSTAYNTPNFERGVCVNGKGMSLGEVIGISSGITVNVFLVLSPIYFSIFCCKTNKQQNLLWSVVFFSVPAALIIGLSVGLHHFPVPKIVCGDSSARVTLCSLNAKCLNNGSSLNCVCNSDFPIGDGLTCEVAGSPPSSPSPPPEYPPQNKDHMSDSALLGITITFLVVLVIGCCIGLSYYLDKFG